MYLHIVRVPHTEKSKELKTYFDDLLFNDGAMSSPVNDVQTWAQCKSQFKIAQKKVYGVDYVWKEGFDKRSKILAQVVDGRANLNAYALWLEILRYQEDKSYQPVYRSYYFVQSMVQRFEPFKLHT